MKRRIKLGSIEATKALSVWEDRRLSPDEPKRKHVQHVVDNSDEVSDEEYDRIADRYERSIYGE